MKITGIDCHVVLAPNYDPRLTSSAQDSFIVLVHTDEGITGIGESDVNPWMAKACVEAPGTHTMGIGIKETLLGADPLDIAGLWQKLYVGTCMNGRRGAVIHAIGAIEMALWDIKGKAAGKPVWRLLIEELGGTARDHIVPYASLQPSGHDLAEYRDSLVAWAERARGLGFRAVKAEVTMNGPYAHSGLLEPYERHTEVVAAVRKGLGPDIALMVDVQYMWPDAATCLATVRDWKPYDLFFLETPLWVDRLDEYAKLQGEAPMPIALGEWQATRWEFEDIMDRGRINVAQPDVGRVGGLIEAKAVCDMAADRGLTIVPHCWKTAVSISATAHLAFTVPHCAFIEFLPPELCLETLRKELAFGELRIEGGRILPPQKPGLGVELDMDALRRYTVA